MLRRVLRAFATALPEIGYCQGQSHVAARLLATMEPCVSPGGVARAPLSPDARVATALHILLRLARTGARWGLGDVWRPGLPRVASLAFQLSDVTRRVLPLLHEHLARIGFAFDMLATQWLLTLLASALPACTLRRVWDDFFSRGWKAIFAAIVALLAALEPRLLLADVGDAARVFRLWRDAAAEHGPCNCYNGTASAAAAAAGVGPARRALIADAPELAALLFNPGALIAASRATRVTRKVLAMAEERAAGRILQQKVATGLGASALPPRMARAQTPLTRSSSVAGHDRGLADGLLLEADAHTSSSAGVEQPVDGSEAGAAALSSADEKRDPAASPIDSRPSRLAAGQAAVSLTSRRVSAPRLQHRQGQPSTPRTPRATEQQQQQPSPQRSMVVAAAAPLPHAPADNSRAAVVQQPGGEASALLTAHPLEEGGPLVLVESPSLVLDALGGVVPSLWTAFDAPILVPLAALEAAEAAAHLGTQQFASQKAAHALSPLGRIPCVVAHRAALRRQESDRQRRGRSTPQHPSPATTPGSALPELQFGLRGGASFFVARDSSAADGDAAHIVPPRSIAVGSMSPHPHGVLASGTRGRNLNLVSPSVASTAAIGRKFEPGPSPGAGAIRRAPSRRSRADGLSPRAAARRLTPRNDAEASVAASGCPPIGGPESYAEAVRELIDTIAMTLPRQFRMAAPAGTDKLYDYEADLHASVGAMRSVDSTAPGDVSPEQARGGLGLLGDSDADAAGAPTWPPLSPRHRTAVSSALAVQRGWGMAVATAMDLHHQHYGAVSGALGGLLTDDVASASVGAPGSDGLWQGIVGGGRLIAPLRTGPAARTPVARGRASATSPLQSAVDASHRSSGAQIAPHALLQPVSSPLLRERAALQQITRRTPGSTAVSSTAGPHVMDRRSRRAAAAQAYATASNEPRFRTTPRGMDAAGAPHPSPASSTSLVRQLPLAFPRTVSPSRLDYSAFAAPPSTFFARLHALAAATAQIDADVRGDVTVLTAKVAGAKAAVADASAEATRTVAGLSTSGARVTELVEVKRRTVAAMQSMLTADTDAARRAAAGGRRGPVDGRVTDPRGTPIRHDAARRDGAAAAASSASPAPVATVVPPSAADVNRYAALLSSIDAGVHDASTAWKTAVWEHTLATTRRDELADAAAALMAQLVSLTNGAEAAKAELATRVLHDLTALWLEGARRAGVL